MTRRDLIEMEKHLAATYRRQASARQKREPEFSAILIRWAEASERRVTVMRAGPMFEEPEA